MAAIGFSQPTQTNDEEKEKKEFKPIPEGTYNAQVLSVEHRFVDKEVCYWKKYDEEIVFEFVITDGDYAKRRFWKDVPAYLTEDSNNRLRLYLQEIIGINKLPDDFMFDPEEGELVDALCRIRINQYKTKKGETRNGVEDVLGALASQYKGSSIQEADDSF